MAEYASGKIENILSFLFKSFGFQNVFWLSSFFLLSLKAIPGF